MYYNRSVLFLLSQLSLPADLVNLSFCRKKILTSKVDEVAVLKHLSRLVEDIKLFQVAFLLYVEDDEDDNFIVRSYGYSGFVNWIGLMIRLDLVGLDHTCHHKNNNSFLL